MKETNISLPELKKMLAPYSTTITIPAETLLFSEDKYSREAMVIMDGKVEVLHDDKRIATLEKGEIVGETGVMVYPYMRTATVRTLTECEMAVMTPPELASLRRENSKFEQYLQTTITQRND